MKVNSKRNGSHHLPCLSGLSQAPLISNGEGCANNERSTPISAHSLTQQTQQQQTQQQTQQHQSPNRISFNQNQQQPRPFTCGTLQMPAFTRASSGASQSVFFPTLAPRSTNNKSCANLDVASSSSSFSNSVPKSPLIDLNKNFDHQRGCEELDNNYHLYHEPMDPDEQQPQEGTELATKAQRNLPEPTPPPLTPRLGCFFSNMSSPRDWIPSSPRPLVPSSERSPNLHQELAGQQQQQAVAGSARQTPVTFSDRATSNKNDVADDVYFRYVHLKSTERANHRSRSYHGPKNSGTDPQIRDDQSLLNPETNNRNTISSTSVSELQASPSAAFLTPRSPPIVPFRDHCVRELIETEANYVHALEMIITCFAKPLEVFLRRDDNQLIFGHIRSFHHYHSLFQADLVKAAFRLFNRNLPSLPSPTRKANEQQQQTFNGSVPSTPTLAGRNSPFAKASPLSSPTIVSNSSSSNNNNNKNNNCEPSSSSARAPKISTCFLNAREKFLKYGEYCASLSRAQALLDELTSKNEAIAAQLDRCQQEANEGKFKLRDLLSLPMQRILKYHLLLAQLIKNTSSSNEDYQGLKRAHEGMVDLGQYINEVKRDTEALQIMNEIEQSIVGLHMPPNTRLIDYGRLITDGFVRMRAPHEAKLKSAGHELTKIKLAANDSKMKPKRYVFVFDKVMLICKLSGLKRYQYKEALVLSEFRIDVNPAVSTETPPKQSTKDKWAFTFNLVRVCDGSIHSFFAKTLEMKNKWVGAIQRAMDNTRPEACRNNNSNGNNNNAGNHDFIMHTFDKASSCDHCGKLLLGLYYQGYRCRVCFASVHKKCLSLVRSCGPTLPPKSSATTSRASTQRARCKEPPSPSVQSNCSENGAHFAHFPSPSNASSVQHMDTLAKNEYNNLASRGRGDAATAAAASAAAGPSSSFRENGTRATTPMMAQRPVSSMINVSLQNSANHMIQQKRLLQGSASTPSIGRHQCRRVRALQDFGGNEQESGEMKMVAGDIILLSGESTRQEAHLRGSSHDHIDGFMLNLTLSARHEANESDKAAWLAGRNLRTGAEGRFPAALVESVPESPRDAHETPTNGHRSSAGGASENQPPSGGTNGYVNFPLSDQPWFSDRMDRDQAQALLEQLPHGTFLVRVSPKHHNSYVISLKYNSKVMHMRVYVAKDNQLYLSQNRYFNSLVELVSWYEENSLIESFNMLDACLAHPYKLQRATG